MAQQRKTALICSDRFGRPYVLIFSAATTAGGKQVGSAGRAISLKCLADAPSVAQAQGATLVPLTH